MAKWLTPEELQRKKELKRKYLFVSLTLVGALIGGLITVLISSL